MDRLIEKIVVKSNPTVLGLDPNIESLPPQILAEQIQKFGKTQKAAGRAIFEFNKGLIDTLCDIIPAIKPQLAYYEMYGVEGMIAFNDTVQYAKEKGMYIIADGKRNDIGSTAEAYAKAYLGGESEFGGAFYADSLTINGYLGTDGIKPFIKACKENDKSVFMLVKTSNPSSGELQNIVCGKGTIFNVVAELGNSVSLDTVGKFGYSRLGFVVGATYPAELGEIRRKFPKNFFLVPGYGAQGAKAKDICLAVDKKGLGVAVNSSRGIIYAYKEKGDDGTNYLECAREAAIAMREDLRTYL